MAIKTVFTAFNKLNLLSTINIALTGIVASTPIDGVLMTNGMYVMLTNQTNATQIGGYSVAVTGANYTLISQMDLSSGAGFANPFLFEIVQGTSNQGTWAYNNFFAPTFHNLYLARNAIGGVAIIGSDGYIPRQFISPNINQKLITPAQSPYLLSLDEYSFAADCNTGNVTVILPLQSTFGSGGVLFQGVLARATSSFKLTIQTQAPDQAAIGATLVASYDIADVENTQFITGNDVTNLALPAYTIDS